MTTCQPNTERTTTEAEAIAALPVAVGMRVEAADTGGNYRRGFVELATPEGCLIHPDADEGSPPFFAPLSDVSLIATPPCTAVAVAVPVTVGMRVELWIDGCPYPTGTILAICPFAALVRLDWTWHLDALQLLNDDGSLPVAWERVRLPACAPAASAG